jgi:hypothetical protein
MKERKELLDSFGELVVREIRDAAIREADVYVRSDPRWQRVLDTQDDVTEIVEKLIPDIVDLTVFRLMHAIDSEAIRPETIPLEHFHELAGWYLGEDGWCERFARERLGVVTGPEKWTLD